MARSSVGHASATEVSRIVAPRPDKAQAQAIVTRLGFDPVQLDHDLTSQRAKLRASADEQLNAAVAASATSAATLARNLHALTGDLLALGSDAAPSSGYYSVAVPSRIFASGIDLVSSNVANFNSTAKVNRPQSDSSGHQEVVFSFPYVNASGVDQVITVTGVIGLNGVVEATDEGGYTIFGHDHNYLLVQAVLRAFGADDTVPGTGLQLDSYQFADLDAYEGGWPISVGAIVSQPIMRGTALGGADLLVKAGATRVFELAITFDSTTPNGDTSYDFSSGGFDISGFGLFVHVTS